MVVRRASPRLSNSFSTEQESQMAECKLQSGHLGQRCSEAYLDFPPVGCRSHSDLYLSIQASSTCLYSTIPWLSMCFTPQDLAGDVAYLRVSDFTNPPIVPGSQHLTLAGSCARECAYTVSPQGGCQLSLA